MESENLSASLNLLKDSSENLKKLGYTLFDNRSIRSYDLFCASGLHRSINIIDGYILLIENKNVLTAFSLVRLQLDTLLRLFAATQSELAINDFVLKIFDGAQINHLKSKSGEKLTDGYLVKKISELKSFSWVQPIYVTASGFIHFSDQHVFASIRTTDEKNKIEGLITSESSFIKTSVIVNATDSLIQITFGIIALIENYISSQDD